MCKVQLILVDGMCPDSLSACGNPFVGSLLGNSLHTLSARTVMPSVTLPCHMSLFHSVDPARHGITTNTYMPQVRPIDGLCERLKKGGKKAGFYYNWEELKDLSRPDSLAHAAFHSGHCFGYEEAIRYTSAESTRALKEYDLDFTFTYFGWPDAAGHESGWMSGEFLHSVNVCWTFIQKMIEEAPSDTVTVILADHGGHDRTHGTDMPEDMLIPIIIHGAGLKGTLGSEASIKDVAPTIVHLLGCTPAPEWEGTSLI